MLRTALIVVAGLSALTVATTAQADTARLESTPPSTTEESRQTCSAPLVEQPFTRFGDRRNYVMAPHGSFEKVALSGWQLSAGAKRVTEADPIELGAHDGTGMLSLSARATAISPTMCVDLDYPSFRILVKAVRLPDAAEFKIEVVYPDSDKPEWVELTKFDGKQFSSAGSGWRLTSDIDMKPDLGGKATGYRRVAFRLTALTGNWRIDDLYVDPRRRI